MAQRVRQPAPMGSVQPATAHCALPEGYPTIGGLELARSARAHVRRARQRAASSDQYDVLRHTQMTAANCQQDLNDGNTMMRIRQSTEADGARVLEIWRSAVDATHHFLRPEDRSAIESEVAAFLPCAPLDLAIDEAGQAVGFMLLNAHHMEALFIDARHRGSGVGRLLVEEALRRHSNLSTDVNEQNRQAVGFYERMGFERCGRSALDGQGRPYPLIHLRYQQTP